MNKKILLKILAVPVIIITYIFTKNVFTPVITDKMALNQMEDTANSYTSFNIFRELWQLSWILPIIICLIIFRKELIDLFYKIKGGY